MEKLEIMLKKEKHRRCNKQRPISDFDYERKLAHNGCVLFSLLFGFVAKDLYHSIIYACVIHQRTKIYLDQIVSHTLDMQDFPCILYSLVFLIQVLM